MSNCSFQIDLYIMCNKYFIICNVHTGDFMKKVPTATCALRDRYIVSIERVYTLSTFYMKSAVYYKHIEYIMYIVHTLYNNTHFISGKKYFSFCIRGKKSCIKRQSFMERIVDALLTAQTR